MRLFIILFLLSTTVLMSDMIDSLLQEYETTTDKSLQTIDEKLGHVILYSQKEIRLGQYDRLSDILKELPQINMNRNRFGILSPSLAGSKTTTSGFFRFFINDHEVSSAYSQSPSLSWGDLPLDFIDHIEIYYGESSFALGNETGIYFVRMYTKSAKQENGGELKLSLTSNKANSQALTHSQTFENGWSYLLFLNNEESKIANTYKDVDLKNDGNRKYFYADISNETTKINVGYTSLKKENYLGLSLDAQPDYGKIESKDFFINVTKYFLNDKSIKATVSLDRNNEEYEEKNAQGIGLVPVLDLANMGLTIPKEFTENIQLTKSNAYLSKSINYKDNNILIALNLNNKKYEVKERTTVNFANQETNIGKYNNFDEETVYSLLFQDDYKVNEEFYLILNAKLDSYERNSNIEDFIKSSFRIGAIYTPFKNFGLKSSYTDTYLPPSFYNIDWADKTTPNLKAQEYKIFSLEGVFTTQNSKFGVSYYNVQIDNFIYLTPVGFINVAHTVKSEGFIFDYEYQFGEKNKIHLNYFTTSLSENINNSNNGGFVKFMGEYDNFEYFTSLIYRNAYSYNNVTVEDSFDFSIGSTYHFTKDISASLKGTNLFDNSTQSLYKEGFPGTDFSIEDYDKRVTFSLKWVF